MVDHFTKLWLIVSWRSLKLQEKLTTLTELVYSTRMIVNRYISVENFLHNSVPVACGKLIAAWYTARYCRQRDSLQAIQARLGRCHWGDIFRAAYSPTLRLRANGRNIVECYMLSPFAHPVACCWMLLRVAQSLKPVKLFSQQLPTFLLFRESPKRSATMLDPFAQLFQHCWASHAHYAWFTKTYGLYPSHDALQAPTLLGVVASVWTPLPTRTQQLPTLLAQQCWELLRLFARSLTSDPSLFHLHFTELFRIKPPLCSLVKCLHVNASLPSPCQWHLLTAVDCEQALPERSGGGVENPARRLRTSWQCISVACSRGTALEKFAWRKYCLLNWGQIYIALSLHRILITVLSRGITVVKEVPANLKKSMNEPFALWPVILTMSARSLIIQSNIKSVFNDQRPLRCNRK